MELLCPACQQTFDADAATTCPTDGGPLYPVLRAYTSDARAIRGKVLHGRYVIDGLLGKGAMGIVLSARHVFLDKPVAIKVLHPSMVQLDTMKARFLREARASSGVEHPNVVSITDFGVTDTGLHYLVMEYLEGSDLWAWFERNGTVDYAQAARFGLQLCGALAAVHDAGYVHRDLKPENVWVTPAAAGEDPQLKLLDFGIAGVMADDGDTKGEKQRLTATGNTIGTVSYMSPEQVLGQPVDGRSDLYALGCMLYELVTGDLPFYGENPMATMMQHLNEPTPSAVQAAQVPGWFDDVLQKLMHKQPDRRFRTARDAAAALRAGLAGSLDAATREDAAAPATGVIRSPQASSTGVAPTGALLPATAPRRRWWWLGLVAVAVVAAVVGVSTIVGVTNDAPPSGTADGAALAQIDPPTPPVATREAEGTDAQSADAGMAPADAARAAVDDTAAAIEAAVPDAPTPLVVVTPVAATPSEATPSEATPTERPVAAPPRPTPARPQTVTVALQVLPKGTLVLRDGERLGRTPLTLTVTASDQTARYSFRASGHKPVTRAVSHARDVTIALTLPKEGPKATPSAPSSPSELMRPTLPGGSR